jgi:hypothetical protein
MDRKKMEKKMEIAASYLSVTAAILSSRRL